MNKFALIALFACVAAASAVPIELSGDELESSAWFSANNDEEVAELNPNHRAFADFCLSARDHVYGQIRGRTNGLAANMFSLLFNSAEEIGLNAVDVQRDATNKLANQIREPSAPISEPKNDVEQIIADAQKSIQGGSNQPKSLMTGLVSVLAATKNAVTSQLMTRLRLLKDGFGLRTLTGAFFDACAATEAFEFEIRDQFEEYKNMLSETDPGLAKLQLQDVSCLTSRRVIRLDGMCKFAMAVQNPLIKAITYRPLQQDTQKVSQ